MMKDTFVGIKNSKDDGGNAGDEELWDDDKYVIDSLGWISISK